MKGNRAWRDGTAKVAAVVDCGKLGPLLAAIVTQDGLEAVVRRLMRVVKRGNTEQALRAVDLLARLGGVVSEAIETPAKPPPERPPTELVPFQFVVPKE